MDYQSSKQTTKLPLIKKVTPSTQAESPTNLINSEGVQSLKARKSGFDFKNNSVEKHLTLNGYDQIEMVGKGSHGTVYSALHVKKGILVAAKVLRNISRDDYKRR